MRIIIAGGRKFQNYQLLKLSVDKFIREKEIPKSSITIIGGEAPGADRLGKQYAKERGYKYRGFDALWDRLDAPGAIIKENQFGKRYNAKAGYDRNLRMAQNADWLIAFWDGQSPGTKSMISIAHENDLGVTIIKFA